MTNYLKLHDCSLFFNRYIFVDVEVLLHNRLFAEDGIMIKNKKIMTKEDSLFRLISCSVKKRDAAKFAESMKELRNRMLLLGYRGYDEICEMLTSYDKENAAARHPFSMENF